MSLKRVIKCPAAHSGKHALIVSLFPLFCPVLLLLSGCSGRNLKPPTSPVSGETESGETLEQAGENPGNPNENTSPETSASVLTRDDLKGRAKTLLDTLTTELSTVSRELEGLESQISSNPGSLQLVEILSNAERWLNDLIEKTEDLQSALEDSRYKDKAAPGLPLFSGRLNTMLRVIHRNQTDTPTEEDLEFQEFQGPQHALGILRTWVTDLTKRAQALPDVPPPDSDTAPASNAGSDSGNTPNTTPSGVNEMLQGISETFDQQFSKILDLGDTILKKVESLPTTAPRASLGWIGFALVVVSTLNFLLLLCVIYLLITGKASQGQQPPSVSAVGTKQPGSETPIYDVKAKVSDMSNKLDRLSERVEEMYVSLSDSYTIPPAPVQQALQPSKPEIQYFKVTKSSVVGSKTILQKKGTRGEIWGIRANNNSQEYGVFPSMSSITDNGARGIVERNVLTTGDIKECFEIPKQLPLGKELRVTVIQAAKVRQVGTDNQYELVERGQLSVS